jgi:magnesium-transporting ATPase (P-type)
MKGTVSDGIHIAIFIFILSFMVVIGYFMLDSFDNSIRDIGVNTTLTDDILEQGKLGVGTFNWTILLIYFALFGASLVGAYLIRTHPIFAIASFFIILVVAIISGMLSNTYVDMLSSSGLDTIATTYFPIPEWLMANLPFLMVFLDGIIMVVQYSRGRGRTGAY